MYTSHNSLLLPLRFSRQKHRLTVTRFPCKLTDIKFHTVKTKKGRVHRQIRHREPRLVGRGTEGLVEHGPGVARPTAEHRPRRGRRHSAGVCWHSQRPLSRGGGEARWYHGVFTFVLDVHCTLRTFFLCSSASFGRKKRRLFHGTAHYRDPASDQDLRHR